VCTSFPADYTKCLLVGWVEFNVPFQHKCGYIRDEPNVCVQVMPPQKLRQPYSGSCKMAY